MKIAAVIVTYNRLNFLKKSIKKSFECGFDYIVIVNNNSTDGTKEFLNTINDNKVHILNMKKNLGGAGGFYYGFKYVVENLDVEWLLCYDDDAYPNKNILKEFEVITKKIDKKIVAIASAVYLPNGEISKMNIPRLNFLKKFKIYIPNETYKKNECVEIFMSSFVGLFVKVDYLIKYNHFPKKEFFIYGDDLLFTLEINKNNKKLLFCPKLKFIHDCKTLEGNIYSPIWKVYFTYRNGIILYKTIHPILGIIYSLTKLVKFLIDSKNYSNKAYKKLIFKALLDAYKNRYPDINLILKDSRLK